MGGISNVVIVHGSNEKDKEYMKKYNLSPQNERDWLGWIKDELNERGINCFAPLMPENWDPKYENWKKEFEKYEINENSVLIGHSAGATFLIRWLGDTNKKVKKLILVAPCKTVGNWNKVLNNFYNFTINSELKELVNKIIFFFSDNEFPARIEDVKRYHEVLGGEIIELKGKGHFTGHSMGTNKFPELLEKILE
jgi:predicted alpha/beta hydrolase family esterase